MKRCMRHPTRFQRVLLDARYYLHCCTPDKVFEAVSGIAAVAGAFVLLPLIAAMF